MGRFAFKGIENEDNDMQHDLKEDFRKRARLYAVERIHQFKSKGYLPQSHQIFCHWQIHSAERQELGDKKFRDKQLGPAEMSFKESFLKIRRFNGSYS